MWVLILIALAGGPESQISAMQTAEFESQKACGAAAQHLMREHEKLHAHCVEKGEKKGG